MIPSMKGTYAYLINLTLSSKKTGDDREGYDIIMHVHVNPDAPVVLKQKGASNKKADSVCYCQIF